MGRSICGTGTGWLVEESSVRAVRFLSGLDRLRLVDQLFESARELVTARVREQHPAWAEDRVVREVARRFRDAD